MYQACIYLSIDILLHIYVLMYVLIYYVCMYVCMYVRMYVSLLPVIPNTKSDFSLTAVTS